MIYLRNTDQDVVLSNMVEVDFVGGSEDGFRKVKETLERMGIPKKHEKVLVQTAHVLHKQGRYYICHFLELLALDGREVDMKEDDVSRRNLIVKYLTDWELIKPISNNWSDLIAPSRALKVIKYDEKEDWKVIKKYTIGKAKRAN